MFVVHVLRWHAGSNGKVINILYFTPFFIITRHIWVLQLVKVAATFPQLDNSNTFNFHESVILYSSKLKYSFINSIVSTTSIMISIDNKTIRNIIDCTSFLINLFVLLILFFKLNSKRSASSPGVLLQFSASFCHSVLLLWLNIQLK